jgi:ribonuclease-3
MGFAGRQSLENLLRDVGYQFSDIGLLETAITHKSYVNEHPEGGMISNERLEFLGDAVLDLVISHLLMSSHPEEPEGVLSRRRAALVNEKFLARKARSLGLGEYILLGKGEEQTQGRQKISLLANAYEALLAAIYIDGGFESVFKFIQREFHEDAISLSGDPSVEDFKTRLQEFAQAHLKIAPRYSLVGEEGPDHEKIFHVQLDMGKDRRTMGHAKSKKEAEQMAAREMLGRLQELNNSGDNE